MRTKLKQKKKITNAAFVCVSVLMILCFPALYFFFFTHLDGILCFFFFFLTKKSFFSII